MKFIEDFLEYKSQSKNIKKETVEVYKKDIENFENFIKKNILEAEEKDIIEYVNFLKLSYRPSSIARKTNTLKGFYKYLLRKNLIKYLPTDKIEIEKNIEENKEKNNLEKHFEVLSDEEIKKILDISKTEIDGDKIKLLIELIVATNLSINNLLKIKVSELELSSYRYLFSKKEIYISKDLEISMRKLAEKSTSNLLFDGLSRQLFRLKFISLAKKAGIEKEISPNMLRKTSKEKVELEKRTSEEIVQQRIREKYFKIGIGDD